MNALARLDQGTEPQGISGSENVMNETRKGVLGNEKISKLSGVTSRKSNGRAKLILPSQMSYYADLANQIPLLPGGCAQPTRRSLRRKERVQPRRVRLEIILDL